MKISVSFSLKLEKFDSILVVTGVLSFWQVVAQWGSPSASDPRAKNTGQRATQGTVLTSQSLSPWCDCRRLGSTLGSRRWQDINVGNPVWQWALFAEDTGAYGALVTSNICHKLYLNVTSPFPVHLIHNGHRWASYCCTINSKSYGRKLEFEMAVSEPWSPELSKLELVSIDNRGVHW